jgi:3-dehydroquinate dehydratase/shikimate dehydrogenase
MNKGKICVSVCAETAEEFIENVKRAAEIADVVELRFDCLEKSEIDIFYQNPNLPEKCQFVTTFRPKEQGGFRELTQQERDYFWNGGYEIGWADCEEDIIEDSWHWLWEKRICSFHDFKGVPENLCEIYERLKKTGADIVKIAVRIDDVVDSIEVWKLLEKAGAENKEIIPIAMGEAGKWTRILGLAHGAFLTYASLETGRETAGGQLTAEELIETYRVKELNENTEVYGIIGRPVAQSVSPAMHNAAFKFHKLNSVYVPFEVKNLAEFVKKFIRPETREIDLNFRGFSVTIPHKRSIIEFLDDVDETAKAVGAVNTVKIENGRLFGYNTDAEGFIEPLKNSYGDLSGARVALLGAGGAARAAIFALKKENASITVFARDLQKGEAPAKEFEVELKELTSEIDFNHFDVLINATPLGMKGEHETKTPCFAEQIKNVRLVYDLVYNPFQTRLMNEADKAHVPKIGGLAMLVAQAAAQQKIWTGFDAPIREMSRAALEKLK